MDQIKDKVTIAAVGDICLSDHLLCPGFGVASQINKHGYDFLLAHTQNALANCDITFGNLECVLSNIGLRRDDLKSCLFRGHPDYIKVLTSAGFNVLNLANNHTMQQGPEAFNDTVKLLQAHGIKPLGLRSSSNFNSEPVTIYAKRKTIGMLGYSFEKERRSANPLYAVGTLQDIVHDIHKLKKSCDTIVISCHWGLELMNRPSCNTIKLARTLIEAGANIILGHHSHTIQGVEQYKRNLIFYSLGNFIFDQFWDKAQRTTGIFKIVLKNDLLKYTVTEALIKNNCQLQFNKINSVTLNRLNPLVQKNPDQATEYNNLEYYLEYNSLEKKVRILKLFFLLRNLFKLPKKTVHYLISTKIFTK